MLIIVNTNPFRLLLQALQRKVGIIKNELSLNHPSLYRTEEKRTHPPHHTVHTMRFLPEYFTSTRWEQLIKQTCTGETYRGDTQAQTCGQISVHTHLPEWVPLFGKKLEVLVCELQGREGVQFQVCPRAKEGGQVDECIKTQSIIAIVGQVGHEDTDLGWRGRGRVRG